MGAITEPKINPDPILLPDTPGQLCQEPKGVIHLDEELGLCYELEIPCGVSEDLAAERFREQNGLNRNPAVRLQGPSSPPKTSDNTPLTSQELFGVLVYLGAEAPFGSLF